MIFLFLIKIQGNKTQEWIITMFASNTSFTDQQAGCLRSSLRFLPTMTVPWVLYTACTVFSFIKPEVLILQKETRNLELLFDKCLYEIGILRKCDKILLDMTLCR